ncbi:MAG: hypothetical protein L0332_00885 [Chloroflexi bacterium]|nr:hypothetical protein [Chloroflexota bacterium]MCI0645205.1 hypothetical protein [Chloroflexota bacterium]MCI0725277.1 hypothetical protein [Chloroflexota bacterium]
MPGNLPDVLALVNDILQAVIVIFGTAVALYNVRHSIRDRVTRAFNSLLFFVVIVYFTELLVTRTTIALTAESWIRLEWIGIAMVPAAQFHLADALLVTTGAVSRRRRLFVRVWYLTGVAFLALVAFTDLVVGNLVPVLRAPHLEAGPLFPLFAVYYWSITATSIYYVWHARRRCLTHTTRKRMTIILAASLAAPLAVFPYLLISGNPNLEITSLLWLALIAGNLIISVMFAFLTYYIAYFGAVSPDRVVRVRLFKFMARVPLAATIVLLVYVLIGRVGPILGLPSETALAILVVSTVILVEWAVYAVKRPLELILQLTDEPEVRRIQELSERVLTTRDLRQFLESVLAAACEALRTPAAFVAAITPEGPVVEGMIGPLGDPEEMWHGQEWQELARSAGYLPNHWHEDGEPADLETRGEFILWQDFWIRPLYRQAEETLVGIFGIKARSAEPDLTRVEQAVFDRLVYQAASALEDRILQQEVFAAVEGLLPQVTALQRRRSAATFGGAPVLIAANEENLLDTSDLTGMVWDALTHYWGGPKLTESPLIRLKIVQSALAEHGGNPTKALREILLRAIEQQRPEGERSMTTAEWILYNILELKFVQGQRVRDVARRLAMSESDLYRKQRVAIESVARTIMQMEEAAVAGQSWEENSASLEKEIERVG